MRYSIFSTINFAQLFLLFAINQRINLQLLDLVYTSLIFILILIFFIEILLFTISFSLFILLLIFICLASFLIIMF